MRYHRVVVAGLGYELPPKVMSSLAIEDRLAPVYERLGLCHGRLEMMTGIAERRFWSSEVRPSEVASRAGARALARGTVPKDRIGCLIHASVCRDFLEPATANVVHHRLGLSPDCLVFDQSSACLGVVNAMLTVANMIELGQIEAGLVVSGENGKPLLDSTIDTLLADETLTRRSLKAYFASLTIGSGAAAVLLAKRELLPEGPKLLGAKARVATEHHALCLGGGGAGASDTAVQASSVLGMQTDAEALLHAGVALAHANYEAFVEELDFRSSGPDRIVTHQVGRAHHRSLLDRLALDASKAYVTYDRLGNMGSASLPVSLALAADEGFIAEGHRVALLGIGSGLSTVMLGLKW